MNNNYILTDEASNDFLQFSNKDKIDIIPFASNVEEVFSTVFSEHRQSDVEILTNFF